MPQTTTETVRQQHVGRGLRLQSWLRLLLVGFVGFSLALVPPTQQVGACVAIAVGYAAAAVAGWLWVRRRPPVAARDRRWLLLVVDIVALGSITYLAGSSAQDSWTAYVVVTGFFLLPVLSATQLSARTGVVLAIPTVGVYLFSVITTRAANDEPWPSLIMRATVLVAVCAGCILLSRLQGARVAEIAALAAARADLLRELTGLEERERAELSETLHDGALQYVLAARLDLDDVRDGDAEAVDRVDHALTESVTLLRATVSELHPAVLAEAGLLRAVEDLGRALSRRGIAVEVVAEGLAPGVGTPTDRVAYAVVREAYANVLKHAGAAQVRTALRHDEGRLHVEVSDDGRGLDPDVLARRLAEGHIGLASQRLRVEAYGGTLTVGPAPVRGTRLQLDLPA